MSRNKWIIFVSIIIITLLIILFPSIDNDSTNISQKSTQDSVTKKIANLSSTEMSAETTTTEIALQSKSVSKSRQDSCQNLDEQERNNYLQELRENAIPEQADRLLMLTGIDISVLEQSQHLDHDDPIQKARRSKQLNLLLEHSLETENEQLAYLFLENCSYPSDQPECSNDNINKAIRVDKHNAYAWIHSLKQSLNNNNYQAAKYALEQAANSMKVTTYKGELIRATYFQLNDIANNEIQSYVYTMGTSAARALPLGSIDKLCAHLEQPRECYDLGLLLEKERPDLVSHHYGIIIQLRYAMHHGDEVLINNIKQSRSRVRAEFEEIIKNLKEVLTPEYINYLLSIITIPEAEYLRLASKEADRIIAENPNFCNSFSAYSPR